MSETLQKTLKTLNDIYLPDILFFGGMILALNTTWLKGCLKGTLNVICGTLAASGYELPQRMIKSFDLLTPTLAYRLISLILAISLAINVASVLALDNVNQRNGFVSLFYGVYSCLTIWVSAYDILLKSTKKDWADDVKRRHVAMPVTLETGKVYLDPLSSGQASLNAVNSVHKIQNRLFHLTCLLAAQAILYYLIPSGVLYPLTAIPFVPLYREVTLMMNDVIDYLALTFFCNKYEAQFGNFNDIILKEEKDEALGRQWQYFNFCNKPLTKVAKALFFDKARNEQNLGVKEAKAIYYLGRGLLVSSALLLVRFVDVYGAASVMSYYALHAAVAAANHKQPDHFDDTIPRLIAMAGEYEAAGIMFFKPILDHLADKR